VLALAAVDLLGTVVFAGLYAAGAAAEVSSAALLGGLLLLAFAGVTAIWVRVEHRSRGLDPFHRVGRGAIGLLMVLIGLPALVLTPLFWLESQLPLEAVPALHLGPVMALLLVGLALTVAVNALGAVVSVALGVGRRWRARRAP
jgi:hypothetical protein